MNVNINLTIGNHSLHFRNIPSEQEQFYRRAAAQLSARFTYYQRSMPNESVEVVWMYVALEAAVNLHSDKREKDLQPLLRIVEQLNENIEKQLTN